MASQQDLLTSWREYFDEALRTIGVRAPMPRADQSSNDYARETCRTLKHRYLPQNHPLFAVQFRALDADVLERFAPQLVEAVKVEAVNPNNFAPGELRMFTKTNPNNGLRFNEFYGQESFVKQMTRPGRRVVSFITDRGKYDAVKARWF